LTKKKNNKSIKEELINLLQHRMKVLQSARQIYEQNPTLMSNVKMANIGLVQNDIEDLKDTLAHYSQDYSDTKIAKSRFSKRKSKIISGKELRKQLGI